MFAVKYHDKSQVFSEIGTELDASVNFKVNSELKNKFDELCKKNQSNMARS